MKLNSLRSRKRKKNEEKGTHPTDLWDFIKYFNIHIMGITEGEEREKGEEVTFEEIMAENSLN